MLLRVILYEQYNRDTINLSTNQENFKTLELTISATNRIIVYLNYGTASQQLLIGATSFIKLKHEDNLN